MIAYKLFRLTKDGQLAPLFINRKLRVPISEWLDAECHPTKGFAVRRGWHLTLLPRAPHLKDELKSGEKRVWCEVECDDFEYFTRPESQGGLWVLSQRMKVNKILTKEELCNLTSHC